MDYDTLIAAAAGLLSTAAFVPQAWQIWRSRQARDISWPTYAALIVSGGLWIAHGLFQGDVALVATNAVIAFVACLILLMKARFEA